MVVVVRFDMACVRPNHIYKYIFSLYYIIYNKCIRMERVEMMMRRELFWWERGNASVPVGGGDARLPATRLS